MEPNFENIAGVINSRFKVSRERIHPSATFDEMGLDSLSQIELAFAVEKALAIKISDGEIAGVSTVGELVELSQQIAKRTSV